MKIFIDADSCPSLVRDFVISKGNSLNIPVIFAANKEILPKEGQLYEMIVCGSEKDAADNYIFENTTGASDNSVSCADDKYGYSSAGKEMAPEEFLKNGSDLVVTRDLLLAERLVKKNVLSMNDRGVFFTSKNIAGLLKEREEDLAYVSMGLVKHPKGSTYNKKEFAAFANSFSKIIF